MKNVFIYLLGILCIPISQLVYSQDNSSVIKISRVKHGHDTKYGFISVNGDT